MSSYVVGADLIDLMVSYAMQNRPGEGNYVYVGDSRHGNHFEVVPDGITVTRNAYVFPLQASELGRLLLTQNVRSVVSRYQEADAAELAQYSETVAKYVFRPVQLWKLSEAGTLEAEIIRACQCYNYQSDETRDLATTDAGRWSEALYRRAADAMASRLTDTWNGAAKPPRRAT